ncbi:MAG: arginine--tRNA ligase [Bdellovibrionota bacterium]
MFYSLKKQVADALSGIFNQPADSMVNLLERPRTKEHGHLSLPLFSIAKTLGKNPAEMAKEWAEKLTATGSSAGIEKAESLQGFLNLRLKNELIINNLFADVQNKSTPMGFGHKGKGKKVIVDLVSPNIAKPMHVGHLRCIAIGQSLTNLAKHQGYEVLTVNHLGDWGSQFGKLAYALKEWGTDLDNDPKPIDTLVKLYVRFHDEVAKNPELEKKGAECFKKLEDGDPEAVKSWKKIVDVSLKDYDRLFSILKIKHDVILGESFYNDKMDAVIATLEEKNLLKDSEGAKVVFFEESEKMPPCIIKKSDGASIYATRDLAAAIYRHDVQKGDQLLYVVGADQSLHFKQLFRVLELMNFEWAKNCHHIGFGLYRFKEGKMSTRQGKVILFEDILERALEMMEQIIEAKNPALPDKKETARMVAVGALFFNDLVNERTKNVEFDWDRVLSFEGDSGPYVQYTLVRCRSILRKLGKEVNFSHLSELTHPAEVELMLTLQLLDQVADKAYDQFKPHLLAQYLLDVCAQFSQFYHHCRVVGEKPELESARAALVFATERVLDQGLRLLHIETPQEM